jgi:hypothetical protein
MVYRADASVTAAASRRFGLPMALAMVLSASLAGNVAVSAAQPGVSSSDSSSTNSWDKPLFPEPLFPDPLFSDDSIKDRLSNDTDQMQKDMIASKQPAQQQPSMVDQKIGQSEIDSEMRRQMRAVARYLYQYSLRNQSRFPGPDNGEMDEMYAVQVQLTELVPNNPYNYRPTETINWGIPAAYNPNGSPATGSPVWGDQYTEHLQAQNNNRIQLQFNPSLTPQLIDQWASDPPPDWTAAPGTITAIGNNQGLLMVWGAGADGKPIRDPMNGKTFIVAVSTSGTVNDQIAPTKSRSLRF